MKRLSPIELERAKILKAARQLIRMRHSLAADSEINERLPDIEAAFDKQVASGKPYELSPAEVRRLLGE